MVDSTRFSTTSIHLGAAILTLVPQATLAEVSNTSPVDGKKLLTISFPADQEQAVAELVEKFHARMLTVPLYGFNRALNLLRDRLLQRERSHAIDGGRRQGHAAV